MKAFTISLILVLTLGIVAFLRADDDSDLRMILPLVSGQRVCIYDFAGAVVLLIAGWAIGSRLWRASTADNGSSTSSDTDRWRFRWSIVAVVVLVLATVWIAEAVTPAFDFQDILHGLGIRSRARYTQLAVLCVLSTAAVLIVRVATAGKVDEDE